MVLSGWPLVLALASGIGVLLGIVAAATRYCHMGALADWVNLGDRTRLQAWALSIAVGLAGVAILELAGVIDLDVTRFGYRGATLSWVGNILGGFLFGSGMCLAGGCTTRTLVNIGNGNLKALHVLIIIGITAYVVLFTPPGNDLYRHIVTIPAVSLAEAGRSGQDPGHLLAISSTTGRVLTDIFSLGIVTAILIALARYRPWRQRRVRFELLGGAAVGLLVLAGWYVTGSHWARDIWDGLQWSEQPPAGMGAQSLTFTGPSAEWLRYLAHPDAHLFTFGMLALLGVIVGAMGYQVWQRVFKLVWFTDCRECIRYTVGAMMMGVGGVLAGGCSVGQGLTGISTLGVGSLLALAGILGGGTITMKIIFYSVMFPESTFVARVAATLADVRLLPRRWHRLDAPVRDIKLARCGE